MFTCRQDAAGRPLGEAELPEEDGEADHALAPPTAAHALWVVPKRTPPGGAALAYRSGLTHVSIDDLLGHRLVALELCEGPRRLVAGKQRWALAARCGDASFHASPNLYLRPNREDLKGCPAKLRYLAGLSEQEEGASPEGQPLHSRSPCVTPAATAPLPSRQARPVSGARRPTQARSYHACQVRYSAAASEP